MSLQPFGRRMPRADVVLRYLGVCRHMPVRSLALLSPLIFSEAIIGCRADDQVEIIASPDAGSADAADSLETIVTEDSGGFDDPDTYHDSGAVVDGGFDCGELRDPTVESTCCNGVLCNGDCVLHDGLPTCDCFGIVGGCPVDRVCCAYNAGGCTTRFLCGPH